MTLKMRIELIFLGIAIMATILAIISILVATQQLLTRKDLASGADLFAKVDTVAKTGSSIETDVPVFKDVSAERTSSESMVALERARKHLRAQGKHDDLVTAHDLLITAVKKKSAKSGEAAYELGKLYRMATSEDCQIAAFGWFQQSANRGYRKAHLELAKSYVRGLGTSPDYKLAVEHYTVAARLGSAAGALALIDILNKGTADTKSNTRLAQKTLTEFMPLLEKAARSGNGRAARSIARIYMRGDLIEADYDQAIKWFTDAVEADDGAAMHDLALFKLEKDAKNSDANEIVDLLKRSAALSYSGAMTALGRLHLKEQLGLKRDGAIVWFSKGAAAGHAGSMKELAELHFKGDLVPQDIKMAEDFATRGANLQHSGSIKLLEKIKSGSLTKIAAKE